ncbi:hypothetical protein F4813DRAFT_371873 [Daldinia decipiens]|uniref:uncharacterized protein n=1 Tax=Daldinia decipiens TaxID=326647 RepID=UPI0020C27A43|nr:uncharacterized protein F4813DRAFT_371873 [Daldinia decipiens]KAI1654231.1 hypothetical protein F4813DRAFT_371873 [Daldinia decipiens]
MLFLLSFVAILLLYARIGDIFGRGWLFFTIIALLILGSEMCGGLFTMGILITSRTILIAYRRT